MNSATSHFEVNATGVSPKQLHGVIPTLKLADGNEIPMVRSLLPLTPFPFTKPPSNETI